MLSVFVLPGWFAWKLHKRGERSDDEYRMILFLISIAMGILDGHSLSHLHLNYIHLPTFIIPLLVGISAVFLGPKFAKNRLFYLGSVVGSALGVYLLLGLLFKNIRAEFLIWIILAAAAILVNLQIQLARPQECQSHKRLFTQFCVVLSLILLEFFVRYFFGSRPLPPVNKIKVKKFPVTIVGPDEE